MLVKMWLLWKHQIPRTMTCHTKLLQEIVGKVTKFGTNL